MKKVTLDLLPVKKITIIEGIKMTTKRFVKPLPQEVEDYAATIDYTIDGEAFCDHYQSKGWCVGKSPMRDWKAAVRTWKRMDRKRHGYQAPSVKVEGKTIKETYLENCDETKNKD